MKLSLPLLFLLFPYLVQAQTYYRVSHTNGVQTVGTNPVTVNKINGPADVTVCTVGPYCIGYGGGKHDGYEFEFTYPVTIIRMELVNIGFGDTAAVYINDTFYALNNTHILAAETQALKQSCQINQPITSNITAGGQISTTGTANSHVVIEIHPGKMIHKAKVMFTGSSNGTGLNHSLYYATDPHVYVKEPFLDSIFCAGDSLNIPYTVGDIFNTANTFSVQLSDASGDFTNGTIIGTKQDNKPGNVRCGIASNTPEGAGYRFRIIASMPGDTSEANQLALRIARYPAVEATNNSPICEGETLQLGVTSDVAGAYLNWTGPAGFAATSANPSRVSELNHTGAYSVTANSYGCITTAHTTVRIKPIPSIIAVSNNSPMCEDEYLQLTAKASDTAASFSWTGPNDFTAIVAQPGISDIQSEAKGIYYVTATLEGCVSPADTTHVTIYERPEKPVVTVNSPIKPGDSLVFTIPGTPGATYSWTGPSKFYSELQNPVRPEVDIYGEGAYTVVATLGICTASATANVDVLQAQLYHHVLPNPNNGEFTLKGNYLVDKTIPVEIVNSTGQVVYATDFVTTEKFLYLKFDLKDKLSSGIYFMRLKLKDEMLTVRLSINY